MKNITIKIIIPNKGDEWKVTTGSGIRKTKSAVAVFNYVERYLSSKKLALSLSDSKDKIRVLVDNSAKFQEEPMTTIDEGTYIEKDYALFVLASFLEEFLPKRYLKKKCKLYWGEDWQ